jgi:hypothetical protein
MFQEWNPWYFVKDETTGTMTIDWRLAVHIASSQSNCYFVSKTGVDKTLANVKNSTFKIGALTEHDHHFMGRMYSFALYDYAFHFTCPPAPECAWGPAPDDGDVNVPHDANLTWMPGDYILQHNVFFGANWDDVNSMTDPCATEDLGDELYEPGPLDLDTIYFWRIDEVNGPNTCKGRVWNFTTADHIIVDDFEQYDDGDNNIYYTWYDQRSQQWGEVTGSWLGLAREPDSPVHSGNQAMSYEYYTDDPWANVGGQQDWTEAGVNVLTLFFYGDADNDTNDTEQMYVAIEDTSGLFAEIRYGDYHGEDMDDLTIQEWQQWDIALEDFSDPNYAAVVNDVNLADVARLYIGFGNRRNPIPAGDGIVFFDDIRLYPPACNPEYGLVDDFESYDLGDNCICDTWCDQRCQEWYEATGSWLSLVNSPVHTGSQAMEYWYDTADPWASMSYAEAWRIFEGDCPGPQDWTQQGVKILTLFFYGDADNDTDHTEQMYVGIGDTLGDYAEIRFGDYQGEDMNDLKIEEWQRWDIALQDFSDANYAAVVNDVNLADVARLYIGFGNRRNPIPGGDGLVYFDNIRLYPPMCKPEYGPVADLSGDCFVYWQDLKIMAEQWLTAGPEADLAENEMVDLEDYAVLSDMWLEKQLWPAE